MSSVFRRQSQPLVHTFPLTCRISLPPVLPPRPFFPYAVSFVLFRRLRTLDLFCDGENPAPEPTTHVRKYDGMGVRRCGMRR